jgi:Arm DNA-binding domain
LVHRAVTLKGHLAMKRKLSDATIAKLAPQTSRVEYSDSRGLFVVVQPTGYRSFAIRYRYRGRPGKLTLPISIGLKAARLEAGKVAYAVVQDVDPGAAKRTARLERQRAASGTLSAIADEYFRREGIKLKNVKPRRAVFDNHIAPVLGRVNIDDLRRSDVVKLLDGIEDTAGPAAADAALARLRRILNWHSTRTDGFNSPIVRGMNRTSMRETARSRILTDDEIRAIWKATDSQGSFDLLVRFLLLTAAPAF